MLESVETDLDGGEEGFANKRPRPSFSPGLPEPWNFAPTRRPNVAVKKEFEDEDQNVATGRAWKPFMKRKVVQVDLISGEELETFESIGDASNATGVGKSIIGKCCRNLRGEAGGYLWKFIDVSAGTMAENVQPVAVAVGKPRNVSKAVDQLSKAGKHIAALVAVTQESR